MRQVYVHFLVLVVLTVPRQVQVPQVAVVPHHRVNYILLVQVLVVRLAVPHHQVAVVVVRQVVQAPLSCTP